MTKKKMFLILFCLIACVVNAQMASDKKGSWNYPMKPGMEEWNSLSGLKTLPYSKFVEKITNENFASLPEILFSLKIMASILDVDEYPELMDSPNRETITEFINSGWMFDKAVPIEEIGRMIDNYINIINTTL